MSNKLSKSDDPQAVQDIAQLPVCQHFKKRTWILQNNRRGEIVAEMTCKCIRSEKSLRVAWEDGSVSVVRPMALNPNGLHHI